MKDETTSTIKDSTVNANDGTKLGANEPIEADGKIAKAQDFDGVDDDVNCGTLGGMTTQEPWTISVWVNKTQEDRWEHFWVKYSMNIGTHSAYDPDRLFIEWRDEISDLHQVHIGVAPTQNQFVHLVMSYDGGLESDRIKVFLDGSMPWTSGDILGGIKDASLYDFKIGGNRKFEGIIDEVRISNTARSTGWISTEYANQNSPSTFYEVSEEGGFAVGTNMQVNISDVWKDIPLIKININDVWKDIEGAQINVNDVWKTLF